MNGEWRDRMDPEFYDEKNWYVLLKDNDTVIRYPGGDDEQIHRYEKSLMKYENTGSADSAKTGQTAAAAAVSLPRETRIHVSRDEVRPEELPAENNGISVLLMVVIAIIIFALIMAKIGYGCETDTLLPAAVTELYHGAAIHIAL